MDRQDNTPIFLLPHKCSLLHTTFFQPPPITSPTPSADPMLDITPVAWEPLGRNGLLSAIKKHQQQNSFGPELFNPCSMGMVGQHCLMHCLYSHLVRCGAHRTHGESVQQLSQRSTAPTRVHADSTCRFSNEDSFEHPDGCKKWA